VSDIKKIVLVNEPVVQDTSKRDFMKKTVACPQRAALMTLVSRACARAPGGGQRCAGKTQSEYRLHSAD